MLCNVNSAYLFGWFKGFHQYFHRGLVYLLVEMVQQAQCVSVHILFAGKNVKHAFTK